VHTIHQVKALLAAAECLPETTTIIYGETEVDEESYRRAVDLLDSQAMIADPHVIDGASGSFETFDVVEPESGDILATVHGPYGVTSVATFAIDPPLAPVVTLGRRDLHAVDAPDEREPSCTHPGCTNDARRIIAGRPVCSDPEHQDAAAHGTLGPVA
jgi:hypothetical protein